MPRVLTVRIADREYAVEPLKVDRKKLYGWTEIEAVDDEKNLCKLVSTDETGSLLIGRGGVGMGIFSPDGDWVERSSLKVEQPDGSPAPFFPSSFKTGVDLDRQVAEDEFLDYDMTDFYQLRDAPPELKKEVGDRIFSFSYSYGDSYEPSRAFLMAAGQGLFMLIGCRNQFDLLCPANSETIGDDDEELPDDLDFSMFG